MRRREVLALPTLALAAGRCNVEWLSSKVEGVKIWPIVRAWDDPSGHRVSPPEFEAALRGGLAGRATGVMMFTLGAVAESAEKMAVLQRVYRGMDA